MNPSVTVDQAAEIAERATYNGMYLALRGVLEGARRGHAPVCRELVEALLHDVRAHLTPETIGALETQIEAEFRAAESEVPK